MAKPIIHLSEFQFSILKKKVEMEYGLNIHSKNDCLGLSKEIHARTKENISQSTIYRLFFQLDKHHPYQHTLDTIAAYCGYKSIQSLLNDIHQDKKISESLGANWNFHEMKHSLLFRCISNQEFLSITDYLNSTPPSLTTENKCQLGYTIYMALQHCPKSATQFYKKFHDHPVVRECFFELMIDPDFNLPYYETGIKLYLSDCQETNSIQNLQDYIFGNSILARFYFIQNKPLKFKRTYALLQQKKIQQPKQLNQIHLFPQLRMLALSVLHKYEKLNPIEFSLFVNEIFSQIHLARNKYSVIEKRMACYLILEALLILKCEDELIASFLKPFENDFHFKMKSLRFDQILDSVQPNGLLYRNHLTT